VASARGKSTRGQLPFEEVANLTDGWSGADLVAIWNEAALVAIGDGRSVIMAEDFVKDIDVFRTNGVRPRRDRPRT
jgi:transitional endoplasmic reticulum ATPase